SRVSRRPPASTAFPYTTLFRSQSKAFSEAVAELEASKPEEWKQALQPKLSPLPRALDVHGLFSTERDVHGGFTDVSAFVRGTDRSEEHTSELQSRENLVCRLLL